MTTHSGAPRTAKTGTYEPPAASPGADLWCGTAHRSRHQQPRRRARFMGHSKVTMTLTVYAHLFEDDHADAMSALAAIGTATTGGTCCGCRVSLLVA